MASLKVKTTGAEGETPVAKFGGTVEIMVGSACAGTGPSRENIRAKTARRQPGVEQREQFISKTSFNGVVGGARDPRRLCSGVANNTILDTRRADGNEYSFESKLVKAPSLTAS
jgi:hypothetical protein